MFFFVFFFFFKQKTAYEIVSRDWSSDVCSSDLAKEYNFDVTGVTISPQQVKRATELTPEGVSAKFMVDDAMALSFPDASFDVVWSIEAGPHKIGRASCRERV